MKNITGHTKNILLVILIISIGITSNACSVYSKKKKDLKDPMLFWPLPPEPPRIKFLYTLNQPIDIGIGDTMWEKFKNFLLGEPTHQKIVKPYGVLSDNNGRIIVTDTGTNSIHIFDKKNNDYIQFPKDANERLASPIGIAVDSDGKIYISDSKLKKINIYDTKGNLISTIEEGLARPTGIAINQKKRTLYVVDTLLNKILIFDLNGKPVDFFGGRGTKKEEFNFPTSIFIDNKEQVYITDSMNFRIQIFDKDGEFISSFGSVGDGSGNFSNPKGVAVDSEGNIYVVDTLFDNVQIFNKQGSLLLSIGKQGSGIGEFWLPSGIFIDKLDRIYVTDSYNSRIQVFQFLGSTEGDPIR